MIVNPFSVLHKYSYLSTFYHIITTNFNVFYWDFYAINKQAVVHNSEGEGSSFPLLHKNPLLSIHPCRVVGWGVVPISFGH